MIKKIVLILFTLLIYSCDYTPIYSDKSNINFSIQEINFDGDIEINNIVKRKLKRYQNQDHSKKLKIDIKSAYNKISQSKDASGKTTDYKITVKIEFKIDNGEKITTLQSKENFLIKNLTNEFEERKYEKSKKENATNIIINTLVIQLLQI